jgi:hypothetical protein
MAIANRDVEIILHIDETLGEARRNDLTDTLKSKAGIRSADFCPLRYHLMLVRYDRENLTSQDILHQVTNHSVHAQLIGPV